MFRASLQHTLRKPLLRSSLANTQSARKQSTGGSSGGKALLGASGAAVATVGGSVLYAKYNDDFRTKLENTIPYSDVALNKILGPREAPKPVKAEVRRLTPTKEPPTKVEDSLLKKKLERELKNHTPTPILLSQTSNAKAPEKNAADQKVPETLGNVPVAKSINSNQSQNAQKEEAKKAVNTPVDISKKETEKLRKDETSKKEEKTNLEIENRIEKEVVRRKGELESDYNRKMITLQENYEQEIEKQLKRQLAAHVDHLHEQLEVQRYDLERKFSIILEEKILNEKSRYATELIKNLSYLREIETVLKNRQQLDVDERKARQLWLICEVLKDALKSKRVQSDSEPISFAKDYNAMKDTVKSMETTNSLMLTVLDSVTESSLENGVYTEDDLVERFTKINKMCKRVALIDEEGGSMSRYLLSYLQSIFVFDGNLSYSEELDGSKSVDPSKWDTFDILSRVRYCLGERNFEMCLKYANQLKGKPRQVAKDWINDLRVHLEVRQVADILQAQAASSTVRAVK